MKNVVFSEFKISLFSFFMSIRFTWETSFLHRLFISTRVRSFVSQNTKSFLNSYVQTLLSLIEIKRNVIKILITFIIEIALCRKPCLFSKTVSLKISWSFLFKFEFFRTFFAFFGCGCCTEFSTKSRRSSVSLSTTFLGLPLGRLSVELFSRAKFFSLNFVNDFSWLSMVIFSLSNAFFFW